jgi:diadenosine tetraphosphatase ApaH/serine/threonine PP2A family protein phosphatase
MRYLILSDIHANFTALEAVLENAAEYDAVWILGDIVGYGPDPNQCIEVVMDLPNLVCLLGNHDAAVINHIKDFTFNPTARQGVQWTRETVTEKNLSYLENLPELFSADGITLAHGSPREPIWEYLLDIQNATENFEYFETPYCFVGHSHLPSIFILKNGQKQADLIIPSKNCNVILEERSIINPGSVGQPRDRDPRAAYAVFDQETSTIQFKRVEYDIQRVQGRMIEAGLPFRHIQRLGEGW